MSNETKIDNGLIIVGTLTNKVDLVTINTTLGLHNTLVSNGAGVLTHTLPAISGILGRLYEIKNISAADMILEGDAAETIDGNLNVTVPANSSISVVAYSGGWVII